MISEINYHFSQVVGGAWHEDELDLGQTTVPVVVEQKDIFSPGDSPEKRWLRSRKLVCDLVAAGEFSEALLLLQRRVGLINPKPLKSLFWSAYTACHTLVPGLPLTSPLTVPVLAEGCSLKSTNISPFVLYSLGHLINQLNEAHKLTTAGKFKDALDSYR